MSTPCGVEDVPSSAVSSSLDDWKKRTDYVHVLPGRMRLRAIGIYRSPERARHVEALLVAIPGVASASANPLTGMVLIYFSDEQLKSADIGVRLDQEGLLHRKKVRRARAGSGHACAQCGAIDPTVPDGAFGLDLDLDGAVIARKVAGIIASNLLEFALKRAVLALI